MRIVITIASTFIMLTRSTFDHAFVSQFYGLAGDKMLHILV
jgi:hypothetical protein